MDAVEGTDGGLDRVRAELPVADRDKERVQRCQSLAIVRQRRHVPGRRAICRPEDQVPQVCGGDPGRGRRAKDHGRIEAVEEGGANRGRRCAAGAPAGAAAAAAGRRRGTARPRRSGDPGAERRDALLRRRRPFHPHAPAETTVVRGSSRGLWIGGGVLLGAAVLAAAIIVVAVLSRTPPDLVLDLNWSEADRKDAVLYVDGQQRDLPKTGKVAITLAQRLAPYKIRLTARTTIRSSSAVPGRATVNRPIPRSGRSRRRRRR